MTDHRNNSEPDLWANTGNQPSVPPPPPTGPAGDPTLVQPTTPGQPEPTAIQPLTPGPLNTPTPPAGIVAGSGMPPARPPAPPTGGGGPGGAGPGGPGGAGSDRPAWLVPGAIGLGIGVVAVLAIFLLTRDGGDDTISTDVSSTTSILPETTLATETTIVDSTIAADTTIAAETTLAPDTTAAPTTAAPTTAAPTTAAPSTAAPTTAAPIGITPAAPGTALVAGTEYNLVSGCTMSPVPGYSISSYVVMTEAGPLLIESGNDEGNAFGFFSDAGNALDTEGYEDFEDGGFGMYAVQGDNAFEVAVNPAGLSTDACETAGSVRISDPAAPEFGYTHGVVDACATTAPLDYLGYLTEGATVRIVDNEDGTAVVTFNSFDLFDAVDADATLTDDGDRQSVAGEITGSTLDGDTTQTITIDFDPAAARGCTSDGR